MVMTAQGSWRLNCIKWEVRARRGGHRGSRRQWAKLLRRAGYKVRKCYDDVRIGDLGGCAGVGHGTI